MKISFKKILFSILICIVPSVVSAIDDGPRMYWNAPVGTNILQAYFWTVSGNSVGQEMVQNNNNFDTDINVGILGYNRIFDVAGHSAILTGVLSAGKVSGSFLGNDIKSSNGLGDLYLQGVVNLFGAPALSAKEFANYKQDTVLSLLVGVTAPTGDYESDRALNMGANRWNVRVALPFVQTIGDWTPGNITTFEMIPSVWFYGNNDNTFGQNLSQDPTYTLEAHITQDITTALFVSLDYFIQNVGDSKLDGVDNGGSNTSDSLGVTAGYMLSPQMQLQLRYSTTLNPDPKESELDVNMVQFNLNYFW